MEKEFEVHPVLARYICDSCKEGEMLPTGEWRMINPPTFEHECNKCGKKISFLEQYPLIRWKSL
ncbi:hypothetical protein [Bacillus paramycoides]|uniref:hypothetical protein n=1 Tax=Bacillus paramycoides TaxID=2026194 RepID=UPI002E2356FE|nr:hypothetical protein [Bacillus paramycoides]